MMRHKRPLTLLFSLTTTLSFTLSAQSLRTPLTPPELENTLWAYSVQDADTGDQLVDVRAHTLMTPASTLKLVSTATALSVLGPEARLRTTLMADAPIRDGVLQGNLYLVGSGDPSIGSKYLWGEDPEDFFKKARAALRDQGLKAITGDLIALSPWTDFQAVNPRWTGYDTGNHYAAGAYDLNLYDNAYTVTITDQGSRLSVSPLIPDLDLKAAYGLSSTRTGDSLYISPVRDADGQVLITGAYPTRAPQRTVKGAIPNPPLFFAQYFRDVLEAAGITVSGDAATGETLPGQSLTTLYEYASKSLFDLASITNVYSHNLFADCFLRLLGRDTPRLPGHNHTQRAIMAVHDYWESRGMNTEELEMLDGSGLSPENRVTPHFLTTMLGKVHRADPSHTFARTLPRAGKDGTLTLFLKKTPLEGKARLKSGTIRNVVCYAGYVYVGSKTYTVALMVNNYYGRASTVRKGMERVLLDTFF